MHGVLSSDQRRPTTAGVTDRPAGSIEIDVALRRNGPVEKEVVGSGRECDIRCSPGRSDGASHPEIRGGECDRAVDSRGGLDDQGSDGCVIDVSEVGTVNLN